MKNIFRKTIFHKNIQKRTFSMKNSLFFAAGEEFNFQNHHQAFQTLVNYLQKNNKLFTSSQFFSGLCSLRGLRFGFTHHSEEFFKLKSMLISRLDKLEDSELHIYLSCLNDIGIKDEELFDKFVMKIVQNFAYMDQNLQMNSVHSIVNYQLQSFSRVLPEEIIQLFIKGINQKLPKMKLEQLAQNIYTLNELRIDPSDLVNLLKTKRGIQELLSAPKMNLNQFFNFLFITNLYKEKFEEKDLTSLAEYCISNHHLPFEAELAQSEFQFNAAKDIGVWDPLRWSSIANFCLVISDSYKGEREFAYHLENMIDRKLDNQLIDLNSASVLLRNGREFVNANFHSKIYQQIENVIFEEKGIVPIQILSENLPGLLQAMVLDLQEDFLNRISVLNSCKGILQLLGEGEFDTHLENNLIVDSLLRELRKLDEIEEIEKELVEDAAENLLLMREDE